MDPLNALGVAAAVVQFVQFGADLISKSSALAKSPTGSLIAYEELSAASHRLIKLNDGLKKSYSSSHARNLTQDEEALLEVAHNCSKIASEFEKALHSLKVSPAQNPYKSFRQALKTIWHKEGIETIHKRLDNERQQLVVHLLVVASNSQTQKLQEIRDDGKRVEANILEALDRSNSDLASRLRDFALQLSRTVATSQQEQLKSARETYISEQHPDFDQLSLDISNNVEIGRSNAFRNQILAGLYFPQVHERRSQIHPAHEKTFRWIFDMQGPQEYGCCSFKQWLEDRQAPRNVFWISGKPGSGKSTLMRYLWEAPQTRTVLMSWSQSKPILFATCFFWLAGSEIQKSLQGLLRSLLYDLLLQAPALVEQVMPLRWLRSNLLSHVGELWTNVELIQALRLFISISATSHHLCIFVDGLDEFEGDFHQHKELATMLVEAGRSENVKLCVSSRPLPVFQNTFKEFPQLCVDLLTRDDVETYVKDKLGNDPDFQALEKLHEQSCSEMITEIVDRAQGVFLWVYLVVRWLGQGLTECFSVAALLRRLREIPPDLDEFFQTIIDNIPLHERQYAAMYFKIMLAAQRWVPLLCLYWVEEEDPNFLENTDLKALNIQVLQARQKAITRRLESRCRGLLEVTKGVYSKVTTHSDYKVQFLHRSVGDFLLRKETQLVLARYSPATFSGEEFWCKSTLAVLKTMKSTASDFEDCCQEHLLCTRALERLTGKAHCALFKQFVSVINHHRPGALDSPGSSIALALFWRLEHCAVAMIRDDALLDVNQSYIFPPLNIWVHPMLDQQPLIDLCLNRGSGLDAFLSASPLAHAAETLLGRGASLGDVDTVSATWGLFLEGLLRKMEDLNTDPNWLNFTKLLIAHGVGPRAKLQIGIFQNAGIAREHWTRLVLDEDEGIIDAAALVELLFEKQGEGKTLANLIRNNETKLGGTVYTTKLAAESTVVASKQPYRDKPSRSSRLGRKLKAIFN